MQEWFRICDTDTREQVKAKVEKLFERVAELQKKVEVLNDKVGVTPLIDPIELWKHRCRCDINKRVSNLTNDTVPLSEEGITPGKNHCYFCNKDISNEQKYCLRQFETIFYPLTETFYPDRPRNKYTDYYACKECYEIDRKKDNEDKENTKS